jgi:hypothetical protein
MSAPQKVQGGSDSELSRLKELSAEQREVIWGWRAERDSKKKILTNAAIRHRIAAQFSIRLSGDWELSRFWSWQWHQMRVVEYNGKLEQFQKFYIEQNPNASRQQVREAGISFFMTEAAANGDREGFLDIANLDLADVTGKSKAHFKEREVTLAEQKAAEAKKTDQEKALEFCLEAAKSFPEVQKLFTAAFGALKKAKAAQ